MNGFNDFITEGRYSVGQEYKKVTGTVAIFRKGNNGIEVLIGRRKKDPKKDSWVLPGGHIDKWESDQEGAIREIEEETGIKLHYLVRIGHKFPHKDDDVKHLLFGAIVDANVKTRADDDIEKLRWVSIGNMPELAFGHDKAVFDAAARMFGTGSTIKESIEQMAVICEESKEQAKDVLTQILTKKPRKDRGLLIVFEGIDGAGKSTQVDKTIEWLKNMNYKVAHSKWNSWEHLEGTMKKAKDKRLLTPMLYSLLHAADMVGRYEHEIVPALDKNKIVICDRYTYTSLVRDEARGVDCDILRKIYKNFREPDVLFHCSIPIEVAFSRLMKDKGLSYYGTGMDLNLAPNREENYVKYEHMLDELYKKELPKVSSYHKLNMAQSIEEIFADVKRVIQKTSGIGKYHKHD